MVDGPNVMQASELVSLIGLLCYGAFEIGVGDVTGKGG